MTTFGPWNYDRLRQFMAPHLFRRGGMDELASQRVAETIEAANFKPGTRVIASGYRSPADQAKAIASVAHRHGVPVTPNILRSGIKGLAAGVGKSKHQHGTAVDIAGPYIGRFKAAMAPDLRQPLPTSDPGHFELSKGAVGSRQVPAPTQATGAAAVASPIQMPTFSGMTPSQVAYRQQLGQQMMAQARQPVTHWAQALAGLLNAGIGQHHINAAQRGQAEGSQAANAMLARAMQPGADPRALAQTALANPWTADMGRQMAGQIVKDNLAAADPMQRLRLEKAQFEMDRARRRDPLEMQKLEAQLKSAQSGGRVTYGLNPQPFYREDGSIGYFVPSTAGEARELKLPGGGTAAPKTRSRDMPTERVIEDQFGNVIRREPKKIRKAKREQAIGAVEGKKIADWPKLDRAFGAADDKRAVVLQDIDEVLGKTNWATTGFVGAYGRYVPGSAAHDMQTLLRSIEGYVSFSALQDIRDASVTGGALGQVAVRELELLQSVYGSLAQSQSAAQFKRNLSRLKDVITRQRERLRQAYERDRAKYGSQAAVIPSLEGDAGGAGGGPQPGTVEDGYRFKGGNPADRNAWEKVQ